MQSENKDQEIWKVEEFHSESKLFETINKSLLLSYKGELYVTHRILLWSHLAYSGRCIEFLTHVLTILTMLRVSNLTTFYGLP